MEMHQELCATVRSNGVHGRAVEVDGWTGRVSVEVLVLDPLEDQRWPNLLTPDVTQILGFLLKLGQVPQFLGFASFSDTPQGNLMLMEYC